MDLCQPGAFSQPMASGIATSEDRMTADSLERVVQHAVALNVPFFYRGPDRCVAPAGAAAVSNYSKPVDTAKGMI